jgi:ferritin-like metal-binding protein YciE
MFEHLNTPEEAFSSKLGSALKMEQGLADVLEQFERYAQRSEIKRAFSEHRDETLQHARNLEKCFELLGEEVDDSPCTVIGAIATDSMATIKRTGDSLVDAAILAAAAESEHYEIAVYEALIIDAEARGATEVAALLQRNLNEEQHALLLARTTMKTIAREGVPVAAVS